MIDHRDTNVVRIPIDQITVMNPRERGKVKFKQIVSNISNIGLKKPITVVQRGTKDGKPPRYPKAKLTEKLTNPQHLRAKKKEGHDLAEEIGSFAVRVPLPNLADAQVLVKLFLVNPTIQNPESPHPTRVMALGVEIKGQGTEISQPVAQDVQYDQVGQRVKFTVDGIKVEALLVKR